MIQKNINIININNKTTKKHEDNMTCGNVTKIMAVLK
jgi:hypothetical protein